MSDRYGRLLGQARESVLTEWTPAVFAKLGGRIQRALLAEAVLAIAAVQDEDVPAESVRGLVEAGFVWSRGD